MPYISERRHNERLRMVRPAKLYDPRGRKYRPGCTHNVSSDGALVEIMGGEYLMPGDLIELAIQWPHETPLAMRDRMVNATVVRTGRTEDGVPLLGVRYSDSRPIPQAA